MKNKSDIETELLVYQARYNFLLDNSKKLINYYNIGKKIKRFYKLIKKLIKKIPGVYPLYKKLRGR